MDKQAQRLPNGMQMVDLLAESKAAHAALEKAQDAMMAATGDRAAIAEAILENCVPAIERVTELAVAMAQGMRSAAMAHDRGSTYRVAYAGSVARLMLGCQALHDSIKGVVRSAAQVTTGEEMN